MHIYAKHKAGVNTYTLLGLTLLLHYSPIHQRYKTCLTIIVYKRFVNPIQ